MTPKLTSVTMSGVSACTRTGASTLDGVSSWLSRDELVGHRRVARTCLIDWHDDGRGDAQDCAARPLRKPDRRPEAGHHSKLFAMIIVGKSVENPIDPVLIVGAGPAGLVVAIELARRGVPFQLIDKRPSPLLWDRASVIKSRSLEIFEALGASAEFLRQGKKILGTDFYGAGSRRASFRFGALDTPFPFMLGLPESATERLLTEVLERLGGAVDRGVELVDLQASEAGVRVLVDDRGNKRSLAASWVVATDGLHSKVRHLVGVDFPGHDYPLYWGVVDVRLAGWPHTDGIAAVSFDPPVILIPMGEDRWRINFRCDPADPTQVAHLERWIQQFAPGATIAASDQPQLFHTHCRMATRFRVERVLLAGDAAHACSPIEGHGMNGGIQDAYNLGWKLALVATGRAPDSLLELLRNRASTDRRDRRRVRRPSGGKCRPR